MSHHPGEGEHSQERPAGHDAGRDAGGAGGDAGKDADAHAAGDARPTRDATPAGEAGAGNDEDVPVGERIDDDEESSSGGSGSRRFELMPEEDDEAPPPPAAAPPPAMPLPMGAESGAELDISRELSQLVSRHRDLVEASRNEAGAVETEPVLCFLLADVWFGAPTELVRHVVAMPSVFPVPTTPAHLLGVANLNGQVTPVIDLKRFLEIEAAPSGSSPFAAAAGPGSRRGAAGEIGTRRMVVVHAAGLSAGFPVDLVREVVEVPRGLIQEVRLSQGRIRELARGELRFRRHVLTVLDLPRLLDAARVHASDGAAAAPAPATPSPAGSDTGAHA